jgi:hypothetical protein
MCKALLVITLVGLFLLGSLMTLRYTTRIGLPKKRTNGPAGQAQQDDRAAAGERNAPVTLPSQARDLPAGQASESPADERNG